MKAGGGARRQGEFGATWWGRAWIDALEQRARLDPNRLPRGRTYARHSRVTGLAIGAGQVSARVWGRRREPYRVRVRVRVFNQAEWDRALGAIAARAAHTAALLDGEFDPAVADDVRRVGLDLLPGPGEVGLDCSCPDWASPCKHAAAVCYLTARLLDDDPFGVLVLRGRTRDQVLTGLRHRRMAATRTEPDTHLARGHRQDIGVEARAAYGGAFGRLPAVLPAPPAALGHPGTPAPLAVDPPPGSGLTTGELRELAVDAARRAWQLSAGLGDGGLRLGYRADLARRAEAALGPDQAGCATPLHVLAVTHRRPERELVRLALAWRHGGSNGVDVLDRAWDPSPDELDEGRQALTAARGRARADRNRLTARDVQLRLGYDRRWYRFARHGKEWELDGPPEADPTALLESQLSEPGDHA